LAARARRFFFVFAVLALAGILLWDFITPPPAGGDPFIYHLTFPATWLKAGRIVYVPLPYGAQAATYYPLNTELFYAWLMAPQMSDLLVNAGQVACWLLGALAVAALARETGIGKPGALVGAAAVMLAPGLIQQATVPRVDIAFAAWFLISLYFAFRWARTRRAGHLILFGAALGLLIGSKSIGLMYAIPIALLFLFQLRGRGAKRAASDLLAVFALALAFGGFWYLRNWTATGNPIFPLDVNLFGLHIFPGAYGRDAMRAFHSDKPFDLANIGLFFLGFWLEAFLIFSGGVAMLLAFPLGRRPLRGRLFILAMPWVLIALFWFANPYNNLTNGRFLFPAFLLFGYYSALIIDNAQDKTAKIWMWLAIPAVIATGYPAMSVSLTENADHLFLLSRSLFRLASGHGGVLLSPAASAMFLLADALAFAAVALLLKRRPISRIIAAAACAVFLVAGLNASWKYQRDHKYDWYRGFVAGNAWAQLDKTTSGKSLRIASVGNERSYGLFGTGFRHDVMTVNIDRHTDWQFHDYWRAARRAGEKMPSDSERPQWHRENGTPVAWIDNLRRKKIDLVFITALEPIALESMVHDDINFPVEAEWAEKRPDLFKLLYANSEARIFAFKK